MTDVPPKLFTMPRCLVSLGSNLGDREAALTKAVEALADLADPGTIRTSSYRETIPIGGPTDQGAFLNGVASFHSHSEPLALLESLKEIERLLDRVRHGRWDQRTLDLDLLLYGDELIRSPELCVPHPRMTFRPFVLQPACEIAGHWPHPECQMKLSELLSRLLARDGDLTVVGDRDGEIRGILSEERPEIPLESTDRHRLVIDARPDPWPLGPSGPRLVLADCPREHWRDEVLAALECVWPTAT